MMTVDLLCVGPNESKSYVEKQHFFTDKDDPLPLSPLLQGFNPEP
jgi:hypothetical protein